MIVLWRGKSGRYRSCNNFFLETTFPNLSRTVPRKSVLRWLPTSFFRLMSRTINSFLNRQLYLSIEWRIVLLEKEPVFKGACLLVTICVGLTRLSCSAYTTGRSQYMHIIFVPSSVKMDVLRSLIPFAHFQRPRRPQISGRRCAGLEKEKKSHLSHLSSVMFATLTE